MATVKQATLLVTFIALLPASQASVAGEGQACQTRADCPAGDVYFDCIENKCDAPITTLQLSPAADANKDSWSEISAPFGCSLDSSYDFVLLVLQWPKGQRKIDNSKVSNDFTLHGLWPSNDGEDYKNYPCECSKEVFKSWELKQTLIIDLNTHFPTLYAGNSFGFWAHEWKKHGTCAGKLPGCNTISNYFQKALDLRNQVKLVNALKTAGIMPSDTKAYSPRQIIAAVKTGTGVKPLLGCSFFDGYKAISQISFCYDTRLKLIECDFDVQNNRGGGVTNCDDQLDTQVFLPATAWANQKW